MPRELQSIEEITDKLLDRTSVVFTKRTKDYVKFKLRTKKTLYTIKTTPDNANAIETRISSKGNIEIVPV